MRGLVVIDGSEGGGQMLRNAVALSAVSGRPVRVENIRGARPKPGLRPQHLMAVKAAAHACGANLIGAELGSPEIEFQPGGAPTSDQWTLDVGTAGSVMLVLQCLLPALARAPTESSITLIGGTDVPFAPPFDYFQEVFVPALAELGPRVEARLVRRGFYPKGGGEVAVTVHPAEAIRAIARRERGAVARIAGRAYSLGLPGHIVERMRESALTPLSAGGHGDAHIESEVVARGRSEGCGIVLWAECEGGARIGASALGRRGKRAEEVGEEAAQELVSELESGGAVDSRLADQMIVWMAMADGPSEVTTSRLTDHIRSAAEVAQMIVGARFAIEEGPPARVTCCPG
ncbi:MAG: RNA 3'-phosphate cyclase [Armatimonadota bacterium]|nr:MAG: RNA 3'-phosphate cyclase [Armatimonadota bacterium]